MIESVELQNWRAFDRRQFHFGPGLTVLMGPNGAGKTSVLEAIVYGLTGEPVVVQDRGKLLRNPDQPARVRLAFTVDGSEYVVERTQSLKRAESASLAGGEKQAPLASSHKRVTQEIERLMGVSADFLRRVVYMAEGDVFRFLSEPPNEALNGQVRRVLRLTQLDEFTRGVAAAQRANQERLRALRKQLEFLEQLGVEKGSSPEAGVESLEAELAGLRERQDAAREAILHRQRTLDDLRHLAPHLARAVKAAAGWGEEDGGSVSLAALMIRAQERRSALDAASEGLARESARMAGERRAYARILDLLEPPGAQHQILVCPVCNRPMEETERRRTFERLHDETERLDRDAAERERQLVALKAEQDAVTAALESVRQLHAFLEYAVFEWLDPAAPLAGLTAVAREYEARLEAEIAALHHERDEVARHVGELEAKLAQYHTARGRLTALGYDSIEEAREAVVSLETRDLTLRAAAAAARQTLTAQRDVDLAGIYWQIAHLWNNFARQGGWQVQLDGKGLPVLTSDAGQTLELSQFSGGEKTALLVMVHTILAHHFSRSDFLLVDEPLEHLDPVNRRSLVRFLVDACRRGTFKQVIATTFEESLIRKYLSDGSVQVVYLP